MHFHAVLIAFIYCATTIHAQSEGDDCFADGQSGICVPIKYCDEALKNIKRPEKIQRCGFDRNEPIVCCVTPHLTTLRKCLEYSDQRSRAKKNEYHINVVGGIRSKPAESPYTVALGFGPDNDTQWLCGGSLISNNYVLTAAHCAATIAYGTVRKILAGSINLRNPLAGDNQIFDVKRVIVHPEFTRAAKYNDIALIELNKDAVFTNYVRPICLQRYDNLPNTKLTATGFGKTEFVDTDRNYDLYKVDLVYYNNTYCDGFFKDLNSLTKGIVSSQLCAGNDKAEKDTCQGDSGGPLFYKMDRFSYLVGVTSFGKACGLPGIPAVYSRVSQYLPWIESIVWQ